MCCLRNIATDYLTTRRVCTLHFHECVLWGNERKRLYARFCHATVARARNVAEVAATFAVCSCCLRQYLRHIANWLQGALRLEARMKSTQHLARHPSAIRLYRALLTDVLLPSTGKVCSKLGFSVKNCCHFHGKYNKTRRFRGRTQE